MADNKVRDLFIQEDTVELGYLAFRQSFFRHGSNVKVIREFDNPNFEPESGVKNLLRLPEKSCVHDFEETYSRFSHKLLSQDLIVVGPSASQIKKDSLQTGENVLQILNRYAAVGVNCLSGHDFVSSILDSENALTSWLEIHDLAHKLGIKSEVQLWFDSRLSFDLLEKCLSKLDILQNMHQSVLYIFFRSEGPIYEQLKLIAASRILSQAIHDFRVHFSPLALISSQVKLAFGANVVSYSQGTSDSSLSYAELKMMIRKSQRKLVPFESLTLNEQEAQAFNSMKVYRLRNSSQHDYNSILEVLDHSPLTALGVSVVSEKGLSPVKNSIEVPFCQLAELDLSSCTSQEIDVDFSLFSDETPYSEDFLDKIQAIACHGNRVKIKGFKGLWSLAHKLDLSMSDLACQLVQFGVTGVISSPSESEVSMTDSEIIELHRCFHSLGVCTGAKIEVSAPYDGTAQPFWDPFVQRLLAFAELQSQTQMIESLLVQESKNSFISIQEYLKAVAVCRVVGKDISKIITPLSLFSQGLIQPKILTYQEHQHISDLLVLFGSSCV